MPKVDSLSPLPWEVYWYKCLRLNQNIKIEKWYTPFLPWLLICSHVSGPTGPSVPSPLTALLMPIAPIQFCSTSLSHLLVTSTSCVVLAKSEPEWSQLLFISDWQRELIRVLTSLVCLLIHNSLGLCTNYPTLPTKLCVTCHVTSDVTLSRILSHSVTWVSHAINRKRYLKEKRNGKELSTGEAVHDTKSPLYISGPQL